jgi:hypothetical protein
MIPELNAENIGQTLGFEGVGSVVSKVEEYCAYEERRITLKNEPRILSLRAEIAILQDEECTLEERLKNAQPPCDFRNRRRKAAYYWTVAVLLVLAAFVFSLLAFDPYRLGWKSYLYCLGIAVVTPFLIEEVFERWNLAGLVKTLATIAGIAALLSLISLAVIRGDLLAHEINSSNQTAVTDDTDPSTPQESQNDFYRETVALLRLAMALLAVAMELGAGLALHKAWRTTENSGEDWKELRKELRDVRGQMVTLATEMTLLQNEPAIFVARFWRNFYHAMLTHTVRNAMAKLLLGFVILILPGLHSDAAAQEQLTIVAAIDLSQSVAGKGPDARSDFEKNVAGVTKLLAQVPVSSRVVVLGIADKSFGEPYILLSARVPDDAGYFSEKLQAAHHQLITLWKRRSVQLQPNFEHTDILGALLTADHIFSESPQSSRKLLVIFSDMRHSTTELDFESGGSVPSFTQLKNRSNTVPGAALKGVEVYALGVDGSGKSIGYWQSLQVFWREYFENAGAALRSYSVLRDLPSLTTGTPTDKAQ